MTQADPSDDAQAAEDGALTRLEHKLCLLESAVHELLLAEELGPPAQGLGWARRRHRQLVKFSVIAGGLSALLAGTYGLPPQNPVRMVVDRTVTAVVEQLPDFQPQVSLLNPYLGHPAADVSQPSSSPLTVIHVSPLPTPQPSATPVAAAVPVAPPDSASTISPSGSGPIALPIVTSAPAAPLTSAQPAASPAPSPTPTALPSSPAPSPTGGAGPVFAADQQQQGDKGKKKPKPSPTP